MSRLRLPAAIACGAFALVAPACEVTPDAQVELAYHAEMSEILVKNKQVAKDFQRIAAEVKKGSADAADIGKKMDRTFIPAAQGLLSDAKGVDAGSDELAEAHAHLVQAWEIRVTEFEAVRDAWKDQDLEALNAAADASYASKLLEERYFRDVNVALAPAEVTLTPYP
jgi:hypothetical protein